MIGRCVTVAFVLGFSLLLLPSSAAAEDATGDGGGVGTYVWWAGQDPVETNFPDKTEFSPQDEREAERLYGGDWLTAAGDWEEGDPRPFATYRVEVEEAGIYNFWTRKFWRHGPFRWRFNDQDWQVCGRDVSLHSHSSLRLHVGANWVYLGRVELEPGTHTFELEVLPELQNGTMTAAFDAFVLVDGVFLPRDKFKPDEFHGEAAPGYFAWEPTADPLHDDSPIDLRHLNEQTAGQSGFVRREGDRFVLGDGTPVRFWMVQGGGMGNNPELFERRARRLAKYGVNLVRSGGTQFFSDWMHGRREAFEDRLDTYHAMIAALKEQGVYLYMNHLYWHTHTSLTLPEEVFPGVENETLIALIFFSEDFQDYYLDFIEELVTTENPYTGLPIAEDPAVAFLEVHNESSLLFHTFNPAHFPEAELTLVEQAFAQWLVDKYGSLQAAVDAWGEEEARDTGQRTPDHFDQGRAGLYRAGHLRQRFWTGRDTTRSADQLQFMVEAQQTFYARMKRRMTQDIGVQQVIVPSNWKTASERTLGGLERYTYTGADVVARNSYFSTQHDPSPERFYSVDIGDTYRDGSALKPPHAPGALGTPHIANHPFMVTENNWTRPNRYRAEWPLLVSVYASLSGTDGWTFFSMDTAEWRHTMAVWDLNNPTVLGQFPAAALMYRRGDVTEPDEPAVYERVNLNDAYNLQGTAIFPVRGEDALWADRIGDTEARAGADAGPSQIDQRAFFVGPVIQDFRTDRESSVETVDLDQYIDTEARIVRSMTDQVRWDYDTGVVTFDTPRAQGATGFLAAAGTIELGDMVIESSNAYGSITVIALDDAPLAESTKILVQAATYDRPHGFTTEPRDDGFREITNLGGYPLNVRKLDARVTIRSGTASEAIVLDHNGTVTDRSADTEAGDGALTITLPSDRIYTLIR